MEEEEKGGKRRGREKQGGRDRSAEVLERTIHLHFFYLLPRGRVVYTQREYY